jgi:hypothetical protein
MRAHPGGCNAFRNTYIWEPPPLDPSHAVAGLPYGAIQKIYGKYQKKIRYRQSDPN